MACGGCGAKYNRSAASSQQTPGVSSRVSSQAPRNITPRGRYNITRDPPPSTPPAEPPPEEGKDNSGESKTQ